MITGMKMDHPDFDMAKKVLCSIPRHPQTAKSKHLLDDFGVSTREEMTKYITSLRKSGFKIHIEHKNKREKAVYFEREGWQMAKTSGDIYWQKVYNARIHFHPQKQPTHGPVHGRAAGRL